MIHRATLALFLVSVLACEGASARPSTSSTAPPNAAVVDGELRVVDLGAFRLESGETIRDLKIGYRTFGKVDANRSNVVLFPSWFAGTTANLVDIVPGKLIDTTHFQLVLVDALGDGVSSSPSNSATQPRLAFPKFTIRDMVDSQLRLVTEVLKVPRLHAVMGFSMGGMQVFEWAVRYPELVERVVPVVGTPQLTPNDMLLWDAQLHALESDVAYKDGAYQGRPHLRAVLDIHALAKTTPARVNEMNRAAFAGWLAEQEADTSFDWNDRRRQLEAMLAHDVAKPYGGSLDEAAKRVRAKMLVVVADQDLMVNPAPARAFARALGATVVSLESPCGHLATDCEQPKLAQAIASFL
jgi:homoserine O-acetyltransferase